MGAEWDLAVLHRSRVPGSQFLCVFWYLLAHCQPVFLRYPQDNANQVKSTLWHFQFSCMLAFRRVHPVGFIVRTETDCSGRLTLASLKWEAGISSWKDTARLVVIIHLAFPEAKPVIRTLETETSSAISIRTAATQLRNILGLPHMKGPPKMEGDRSEG
jgi:hypothetical protein